MRGWADQSYEACTIVLAEEPSLPVKWSLNCPTVQPVMLLFDKAPAETNVLKGVDAVAVAMLEPGVGPNIQAP